ncbi:GNAT family N-acetyltransferase [Salinimonas marina]|uniref:GNAT family N-acetyltransferase n=1 Tax=Salinimonas marina TaxID=2785918 RepID=A0A7S9DWZ0_9ALTE|nr:GNAT family N-acetyltransferase [Salinimonas marina]QPG05238.1 GNAT family N-acetyltransferase [Salinimonas marina]
MIEWQWAQLDNLTPRAVHAMYKLRQAVFVLEQTCLYPDIDEDDLSAYHLLGWQDGELVAYARILAPGTKYTEPAMGRVLTVNTRRRSGSGKKLVAEAIRRSEDAFPDTGLRISAQVYLLAFYEAFGFSTVGQPYDEDGIAHIEMVRPATGT